MEVIGDQLCIIIHWIIALGSHKSARILAVYILYMYVREIIYYVCERDQKGRQ